METSNVFAELTEEQIPHPSLFRVAVTPRRARRMTASGIILTDQAEKNEQIMETVCKVVALGDLAFKGDLFNGDGTKDRVSVGSIVAIGNYAGQRMKVKNKGPDAAAYPENWIFFINDQDILTTVPNPDDYTMFNG